METAEILTKIAELAPVVGVYLTAFAQVVLASKAVTVLTPTKVDDTILGGLGTIINLGLKLLNFTSLNIIKDTNADA